MLRPILARDGKIGASKMKATLAISYLHGRGFQLGVRQWIAPSGYEYRDKDTQAIRFLLRCGCPAEVVEGPEIVPPLARRH
jgi:hypothetical protein